MRLSLSNRSVLVLAYLSLMGCATCHEVKISSSSYGEWNADVRHRVCGSYTGFAVAVYNESDGPPDYGEGDKEPFQAILKTGDYLEVGATPVSAEWKEDKLLVIHHDTRMSDDEDTCKPMVIRAVREYQGVLIEYDPKPVVWER